MLRTIAKLWIQWCYDQVEAGSADVYVPRLLRTWIASDASLQQYERSLQRLVTRLSTSALLEVPELKQDETRRLTSATVRYAEATTKQIPATQRMLMFASVLAFAILLGWFSTWSYRARNDQLDVAKQESVKSSPISKEESQFFVVTTMDATKQIASRIATKSIALQSKWDELENSPVLQARDTAKRGLLFVTQKIPASAARAFFSTNSQ